MKGTIIENIQSTLENILSKYKQKSVEIDIQTKDGASIDDWKTQCKLRRELYKEYCKEITTVRLSLIKYKIRRTHEPHFCI